MVDWEDLRHFVALAEAGTLSGAARTLRVDHATVGRRISSLERSLDTTLIERTPKGYRLTAAGRQVAEGGARMQIQAQVLQRAARASRRSVSGSVRISAPPGLATHMLAGRLGAWRERYPELHLELAGQVAAASLQRQEADVAIRLSRPDEPSLAIRRIGRMGFGIYGERDYLRRRPTDAWEFVAFDASGSGAAQQDWLLRFAGNRPVVFRTNDLAIQLAAVRAGVGLAALPHFLVGDGSGLEDVGGDREPLFRDIWLVVHAELRATPAVRAVLEMIADAFRSHDLSARS